MPVKVSSKYQVVIPEDVRKILKIRPGMEVHVIAKGSVIYIVPSRTLEEVSDKLAGRFSSEDVKNYREKKDRKP